MTRSRAFLAFLAILFPTLAFASPAHVRLLTPRAGVALRGGETAEVSWDADALPDAAEEWEAFLSTDGGRHYAIRITPHLNIDRQRASFTVPNITTAEARLLLRFGNERREMEVELPSSFSIEGSFDGAPLWPASSASAATGEEARRGDGGVIAWVAGGRDGRGSHLVTANIPERIRGAALFAGFGAHSQAATMQRALLAAPPDQSSLSFNRAQQPFLRTECAALADVLLVSGRLNI